MLAGLRTRVASMLAPGEVRPQHRGGYLQPSLGSGASIVLPSMPVRLRDASEDVQQAWVKAASLAVAACHNNGWIAGAVEAMVSLMIGDGLQLNAKPDGEALGWDDNQTAEWGRRAEKRFRAYAANPYECDAGGRYTLAQLEAAAIRQWFATGEVFSALPWVPRPGGEWNTRVRLIPSHWMAEKSDTLANIVHGVELDGAGAPRAYHFRIKDRTGFVQEVRRDARDAFGRPLIVHVLDGQPGQVRGITPLAPVLRVLRDYDQLSNATLTAAMIHAIFAATIESEYPSADVLNALADGDENTFDAFIGAKSEWLKKVDIDLGRHGKIPHLMSGEKLALHGSKHPNSTYEAFANFLLREIARCVGALFEDLTGDYRGATYSSIRMGIAKQWPLLLYRRKHVPTPIAQRAYEAWLEEEVDSGMMPLPGGIDQFVAMRSSICRAEWRGPAKPVADEVKAAKAHETYRNMGVMTDEQICADLGSDVDSVYEQRAREKAMREKRGIHGGIVTAGVDIDLVEEGEPAQMAPRKID